MDPVLAQQLPISAGVAYATLATFAWLGLMGWTLFKVAKAGGPPSGLAVGAAAVQVCGSFCGPFIPLTQLLALGLAGVALSRARADGERASEALAKGVIAGALLMLSMIAVLLVAVLASMYLPALL